MLKLLGVAAPTRHQAFPKTRTMNETGLVKDFNFDIWFTLMLRKDAPDAAAERLSKALSQMLANQQVQRDFEASGVLPRSWISTAQANQYYAAEVERYRAIAKSINLKRVTLARWCSIVALPPESSHTRVLAIREVTI